MRRSAPFHQMVRHLIGGLIGLQAVVAYAAPSPEEVEEFLQNRFRTSDLFTAVAGLKPFTSLDTSFIASEDESPETQRLLRREQEKLLSFLQSAVELKLLRNPELEFFRMEGPEGELPILIAMNKAAVARVLQDAEAISVLRRYHGTVPQNLSQAVQLMRDATRAGGFMSHGPRWANAVVGIFLGYPPNEVVNYTEEKRNAQGLRPRENRLPHPEGGLGFGPRDPEIHVGNFANLSREGGERKAYLFQTGKKLLENFKALREDGFSFREIFNRPHLLQRGVVFQPCFTPTLKTILSNGRPSAG